MDKAPDTTVESQKIDALFPINDEAWWDLRQKIKHTADMDYINWLYDQLGELELQLAYCLHLIEERWADVR